MRSSQNNIMNEYEIRKEFKAEYHSDGAIAGVSVAMIMVALASMVLTL